MFLFLYIYHFFSLHFFSRRFLEGKLISLLSINHYLFTPKFSGRVALKILIKEFERDIKGKTIYLPDYICNVVYQAASFSSLNCVSYKTNVMLEPDVEFLVEEIKSGRVGIILFASIFGSSGLLPCFQDRDFLSLLEEKNVKVIMDLCQDITLINKIPFSKNIGIITSFNNKSFPGVMGGGILYYKPLQQDEMPLSFPHAKILYRILVYSNIVRIVKLFCRKSFSCKGFDYSYCNFFPYQFTNYRPSKLQLIMGINGMKFLSFFLKKKRIYIENNRDSFLSTYYLNSAAYVLSKERLPNRKRKASYAKEGFPNQSIRPDFLIYHNKGFDD